VLLEIARRGSKISGEIIDVPQLSKATVLQHLRELKRAGFIQGRIFGAKAEYQLDNKLIEDFNDVFASFVNEIQSGEKTQNT
jgi:ArsR family transcriptional regulator